MLLRKHIWIVYKSWKRGPYHSMVLVKKRQSCMLPKVLRVSQQHNDR
jgi:hypothetical protein